MCAYAWESAVGNKHPKKRKKIRVEKNKKENDFFMSMKMKLSIVNGKFEEKERELRANLSKQKAWPNRIKTMAK